MEYTALLSRAAKAVVARRAREAAIGASGEGFHGNLREPGQRAVHHEEVTDRRQDNGSRAARAGILQKLPSRTSLTPEYVRQARPVSLIGETLARAPLQAVRIGQCAPLVCEEAVEGGLALDELANGKPGVVARDLRPV